MNDYIELILNSKNEENILEVLNKCTFEKTEIEKVAHYVFISKSLRLIRHIFEKGIFRKENGFVSTNIVARPLIDDLSIYSLIKNGIESCDSDILQYVFSSLYNKTYKLDKEQKNKLFKGAILSNDIQLVQVLLENVVTLEYCRSAQYNKEQIDYIDLESDVLKDFLLKSSSRGMLEFLIGNRFKIKEMRLVYYLFNYSTGYNYSNIQYYYSINLRLSKEDLIEYLKGFDLNGQLFRYNGVTHEELSKIRFKAILEYHKEELIQISTLGLYNHNLQVFVYTLFHIVPDELDNIHILLSKYFGARIHYFIKQPLDPYCYNEPYSKLIFKTLLNLSIKSGNFDITSLLKQTYQLYIKEKCIDYFDMVIDMMKDKSLLNTSHSIELKSIFLDICKTGFVDQVCILLKNGFDVTVITHNELNALSEILQTKNRVLYEVFEQVYNEALKTKENQIRGLFSSIRVEQLNLQTADERIGAIISDGEMQIREGDLQPLEGNAQLLESENPHSGVFELAGNLSLLSFSESVSRACGLNSLSTKNEDKDKEHSGGQDAEMSKDTEDGKDKEDNNQVFRPLL